MFGELYDGISLLFSRRWPKVEGRITAVNLRSHPEFRLVVLYQFSIGSDGPYTGESSWASQPGDIDSTDLSRRLRVGQFVTVRYRADDPSVNTLDRALWNELDVL
jgi:Protein of unknown function (DUF3592)